MYDTDILFSVAKVVSLQTFPFNFRHMAPANKPLSAGLVGCGVTVGLLASVVLAPSAIAQPYFFSHGTDYNPSTRDYDRCTSRLLDLKLSSEEASAACARALKPSDLSHCVTKVSDVKGITAAQALEACRVVWRPHEMASCVVDINNKVNGSTATEVLDFCRLSRLPDRFANCVVGVSRATKVSSTEALNTCIDGSYFPREVDPTFISYPLAPTEPSMPSVTEPAPTTPEPAPATPAPQAPATPTQPSQVTPQRY